MPSGVVLGVLTAVSWGSADFLARFATRTLGSLRSVFWMQASGALFVTILLLFAHDWGHLFDGSGWQPWAWGILAGTINTFAMLALYRAFAVGKLSLVGPVSASYPALTVLLALLSGERLSAIRCIGIAVALVGVLLVATGEKSGGSALAAKSRTADGLGWAVAASLSFGFLFWLLGIRMISRTGAIATVWLIRLTGAAITLPIIICARLSLGVKSRQTTGQLYGMGFLDTAAFALSNLGMRLEQVSVVSVLGSLYGAVTVGLAAACLKERITTLQWIGIGAIFGGVALINL